MKVVQYQKCYRLTSHIQNSSNERICIHLSLFLSIKQQWLFWSLTVIYTLFYMGIVIIIIDRDLLDEITQETSIAEVIVVWIQSNLFIRLNVLSFVDLGQNKKNRDSTTSGECTIWTHSQTIIFNISFFAYHLSVVIRI